MKRALHTLLLFGVPLLLSASYVPVGLKGYNADIVLTPYEDGNDSFLDDGWCFYSDNRTARGGLREKSGDCFLMCRIGLMTSMISARFACHR